MDKLLLGPSARSDLSSTAIDVIRWQPRHTTRSAIDVHTPIALLGTDFDALQQSLLKLSNMLDDPASNPCRDCVGDGTVPVALTRIVHLLTADAGDRDRTLAAVVSAQCDAAIDLDRALSERQHRYLGVLGIPMTRIGQHAFPASSPTPRRCLNVDCGASTDKVFIIHRHHGPAARNIFDAGLDTWLNHWTHRVSDPRVRSRAEQWLHGHLRRNGVPVCAVCAYPVMFEVHQKATNATSLDAPAPTTLEAYAQLHRKLIAVGEDVQVPITVVPANEYRHPFGGIVPTSADPLGNEPDVVGSFVQTDDGPFGEIVCMLPKGTYSDTKTSNDWLAWNIPGKLRPPYTRDPDLAWSKHGKLADLKVTLAGPLQAAPQPLLPPPRPIDA
jgi:hypothetical protein